MKINNFASIVFISNRLKTNYMEVCDALFEKYFFETNLKCLNFCVNFIACFKFCVKYAKLYVFLLNTFFKGKVDNNFRKEFSCRDEVITSLIR